jgi:hypothetical protein
MAAEARERPGHRVDGRAAPGLTARPPFWATARLGD